MGSKGDTASRWKRYLHDWAVKDHSSLEKLYDPNIVV